MLVSILIANHNRTSLLRKTLKSIHNQTYFNNNDFEIVIADDGSSDQDQVMKLSDEYSNVKIIPLQKTTINPCYAYNEGYKHCQGQIIIIQNAECKHVGDIISVAYSVCNEDNYITFSCLNNGKCTFSWYNHSEYKPTNLHFCSVIHRKNIDKLGFLFDNDYSLGCCYDDDDLLRNIRYILNLNIVCLPPDQAFVIHQSHPSLNYSSSDIQTLIKVNRELFIKKHTQVMSEMKKQLINGTYRWNVYVDGMFSYYKRFMIGKIFIFTLPVPRYTTDGGMIGFKIDYSSLEFNTITVDFKINGKQSSQIIPFAPPFGFKLEFKDRYIISDVIIKCS